jgi:hypothetical protein
MMNDDLSPEVLENLPEEVVSLRRLILDVARGNTPAEEAEDDGSFLVPCPGTTYGACEWCARVWRDENGLVRVECENGCTPPLDLLRTCRLDDPAVLLPAAGATGERVVRVGVPWSELSDEERWTALHLYALVKNVVMHRAPDPAEQELALQEELSEWADGVQPWESLPHPDSEYRCEYRRQAPEIFLNNFVAEREPSYWLAHGRDLVYEYLQQSPPVDATALFRAYRQFVLGTPHTTWLGKKDFHRLIEKTYATAVWSRIYDRKARRKKPVWLGLVLIRPLPAARPTQGRRMTDLGR